MIIAEPENVLQSDRREQARLALALIDSLGIDGAVFACRANGWDGVLDLLVGRPQRADPRRPVAALHG